MNMTTLRQSLLVASCTLLAPLAVLAQSADAGYVAGADGVKVPLRTTFTGHADGYTQRGNDDYAVGYYVKNGQLVAQNSLLAKQDGPLSHLDLNLTAVGEGFNAVIATGEGTNLTLTGSIDASDTSKGERDSDFAAVGTQVLAADHAKVTIDGMTIKTKGFVRAAFIADQYGQILVRNSKVSVLGANPLTDAYAGYQNSADTNKMISPPWVLGIQGGARGANMLDTEPTTSVIDSTVTSGGWAVLSTDGGSNFRLNVVDSRLTILPAKEGGLSPGPFAYAAKYGSGYVTYFIGNATENFYGAQLDGATYGAILTGGTGYYRSSKGRIELKDAQGKAITTVVGKGRPTVINAVFGFMNHGTADVHLLDGSVVNAEDAVFLAKASGANYVADRATLNSKSGVLLQVMDNDDKTIGVNPAGKFGVQFNTEFNEKAGWPSENGSVTTPGSAAPAGAAPAGGPPGGGPPGGGSSTGVGPNGGPPGGGPPGGGPPGGGPPQPKGPTGVNLTLTHGDYRGNVFNGSGYYSQQGDALNVTIGAGATLTGAISLTETRHVDENGAQNTHFTIGQYYYLGHVANRNYRNPTATAAVKVAKGGRWVVSGESLLSRLSIAEGGSVTGANGAAVKLTVNGRARPLKAGRSYRGDIVVATSWSR